jgi:hypothetical protein
MRVRAEPSRTSRRALAAMEDFMRTHTLAASAVSAGILLSVASAGAAEIRRAQPPAQPRKPLQLAIVGHAAGGGTFAGTLSIQKFAVRDDQLVAIGMVSGTLTGPMGFTMGTTLTGPLALPVTVGPRPAPTPISIVRREAVIQQQLCDLVHIEVQPITIDVLGLQVTTLPLGLDLIADATGTNVLGHLVCTILETVGNVLGLVDLLNALLGLLTGLV